ncbi:hypothetical protein AMEX_G7438 [Astyanax mexicanus]|uniref:Uncharacterized protein n=1 Tax=Astyanax mexicanus TaxID=7994 RepID=A0A8T2M659_ASTMX|nr:hypothetical protein AMEX_G7438 [Astyanax mexicanus]
MFSVAAWGKNQGFPAEQNETIVWHPRAPTARAPTARTPTERSPTAGEPTGGITVVVDTARWRYQKQSRKTIGVIQMIYGVVFLGFGIGFLVFAPAALYIGFLIFNCLSHFLAGCLSIASPLNNSNPFFGCQHLYSVKNSAWANVISVVATTILIVLLLFDFIMDFGYECSGLWDYDCIEAKHRIHVLTGFLTVFTFFACFSSVMFLGNRLKGYCPEATGSVVSMPPTQSADSSMPTAFQDPAGHQESVVSVPPTQSAHASAPTAFQDYTDQRNSCYSDYGTTAMDVHNTCSDDPPSYDECVQTDWQ